MLKPKQVAAIKRRNDRVRAARLSSVDAFLTCNPKIAAWLESDAWQEWTTRWLKENPPNFYQDTTSSVT